MSPTRIAVNGFGRMGRLAMRAAWDRDDLQFVHVNELHGDAATAAHLLCFDSVHGRWDRDVAGEGGTLTVDGTPITYSSAAAPGDVPWAEHGADRATWPRGAPRDRAVGFFNPTPGAGCSVVVGVAPLRAAVNLIAQLEKLGHTVALQTATAEAALAT